jgi:hypothetical protein
MFAIVRRRRDFRHFNRQQARRVAHSGDARQRVARLRAVRVTRYFLLPPPLISDIADCCCFFFHSCHYCLIR